MANLILKVTDRSAKQDVRNSMANSRRSNGRDFLNHVSSTMMADCNVELQLLNADDASATGTLTIATGIATDTCTVNGVTFTCVASGATGNQFNVGGTDTITAANLAAAINGSATALVKNYISASSSGAVVTVKSVKTGDIGNFMTITGGQTSIAASGARLSGGSADTAVNASYKNWM